MKKNISYKSLVILSLASSLFLQGCCILYKQKVRDEVVIQIPDSKMPEYEKLTYLVKWAGLPAGIITASIKGIKKINGRDAYLVEVIVKTNPFCSLIYKIDDRFISYIDVEGIYTLRHEVYRREGGYKKDAVTDFDQLNHKASFKNFIDNSEKVFDIPPKVQDTLSAGYYFMLLPLKLGDRIEYTVCNNESIYQLYCIIQTTTFIKLPKLGRKGAFIMQPYAKIGGEKVKEGKLSAYFSCGKRRVPLIVIIEGPLFTKVIAYLYKIEYK